MNDVYFPTCMLFRFLLSSVGSQAKPCRSGSVACAQWHAGNGFEDLHLGSLGPFFCAHVNNELCRCWWWWWWCRCPWRNLNWTLKTIPPAKHTKSYRKLSFIVSFPIKHGDFHSYVSLPEGSMSFTCMCRWFCCQYLEMSLITRRYICVCDIGLMLFGCVDTYVFMLYYIYIYTCVRLRTHVCVWYPESGNLRGRVINDHSDLIQIQYKRMVACTCLWNHPQVYSV